ncbi:DUF6220 domain-containing protein [Ahrensia sp. 13_GOM-1096m]|uniref:DUF6220 domain-containing protein n=1 Tax=Ahrensia sp. 13_GOM-1096m TaxID=1380380 RepID=UPI000552D7BA|nr:DUF6220 domain-containing protein [Ahrensia sp. 13_GOM-1096m]
MIENLHDTLIASKRGTPKLFIASGLAIPLGLGVQFLLAGHALFAQATWDAHIMFGALLSIPILLQFSYAAIVPHLRGFIWWASAVLVLYLIQIMLAAGGTATLAYHPFNAALLLTASLIMLFKVERRRAYSFPHS